MIDSAPIRTANRSACTATCTVTWCSRAAATQTNSTAHSTAIPMVRRCRRPLAFPISIAAVYGTPSWVSTAWLPLVRSCVAQFLTPDTHTGAPDDDRLVNPFRNAREQRMARVQILVTGCGNRACATVRILR